ncbi:hypothetical protein AcW1_007611 [Taiwanofungus camphoratus]|nr:hypothetical protein AcW2_007328 [Antrodia cinnamomea]KAI0927025.1 hypothetical protein AcV5_007670 [Antrodia cinnamomea]KAI0947372.1 hypothetical protein AcV7_009815 [Antrodia cinnamomea]KAI0953378.1 hypothetical protein AcW1_007611 [Antrodia cinnamomea]
MNSYGNPPQGNNADWNNNQNNYGGTGLQTDSSSGGDWQNSQSAGAGWEGQQQGLHGQQGRQVGQDQQDFQPQQGGFTGEQGRQGVQWTAGQGDSLGSSGYQGNTTDSNTYGAGGDFGSTGPQSGAGRNDWQDNTQGTQNTYDANRGNTQPSWSSRLKGDAEKMAGKMTGNTGMVERGQERKTGEYQTGAF